MKASDYQAVIKHKETGEEIQVDEYIDLYLAEYTSKNYFEIMSPFEMANVLDEIPHTGAKVLAYLLRNKGPGNTIIKQNKEIAAELEIGINSVGRIITSFLKRGMLKKKDRGIYMMNPGITCYGGKSLYRTRQKWEELE